MTTNPARQRLVRSVLGSAIALLMSHVTLLSAGDWPQFLGPTRNGISAETGLIKSWPDNGLPEVWRVAGGVGMSGVSVNDGRAVTLVQRDGKQWLVCHDASTGESRWQAELAPAYRNTMGDGPRATPAFAGQAIYAFTGEGVLAAVNATTGDLLWKTDLVKYFDGKPADYGMACSPLISAQHVIVTIGADQATVVAVERGTGQVAWTAGHELAAGYSSPALLDVAGRRQVVVFHGQGAMGLDPKAGGILWQHPYETDFFCNIATPVAVGDGVFVSAGENHGSVLLGLTSQGDGFDVGEVWSSQGRQSVLRNEWQTSILHDGHLYGFDNVGSAGAITHLTCIDAQTGERKWQQLRFGKGNMIAADGKLFASNMDGELVVVALNPERFEELGRMPVIETTRQAPALANGLLYLRDDREIVCLDARRK